MIYENTVVEYAGEQAAEIIGNEKKEDKKFLNLMETLRSLREFDPNGYQELEDAMRFMRGEKILYSMNLFAEYGLLENPAIQEIIERQERVLAIVRSNKDIESLSAAMKLIA